MSNAGIDALRRRGAHAFDPIRFRFIEALARRAVAHEGETRRMLDGRVAQLLADYEGRMGEARPQAGNAVDRPAAKDSTAERGPLRQLLDHIDRQTESSTELKTTRQFRSTWSKLSVDRRLTQSLARPPEKAGPLHSHRLVLRSLESIRDLSPPYLHRLMLYVDALLWLDQASGGTEPAQKDVVRAQSERKRKVARGKSG